MAQPGYPGPVIVHQPMYGRDQVQTTCPQCRNVVLTSLTIQRGNFSYLMALVVCLICWPCAWLPLVMDGCTDVYHNCPACNATLGMKKPM